MKYSSHDIDFNSYTYVGCSNLENQNNTTCNGHLVQIQPDQINMAVFFWYLVKSDLSSVPCTVHVYTKQVTF